ncbi:MAG TPA: hypothetical protein DCR74_16310 [Achromobacter sp.]|nr:hypothetical protein [Achromobacter sp.]
MEASLPDSFIYTDSDRPVDNYGADEFGFVDIARGLAPALVQAMDHEGLVIGIEGVWGSGKTSLVNYVLREIKRTERDSVEIISLAPWLSGDEESLVGTLLERVAETVEKRDEPVGVKEKAKRWLREKSKSPLPLLLRKYGARTGRVLTPMLKVGGIVVPGMSAAGTVAEFGTEVIEKLGVSPTNSQLKEVIAGQLSRAKCRFLVILDDLDRLEPAQAVEVIRLVRSVADFPRILYLMCYDRKVLSHALERGLGVENGDLFLRKIVQQTFSIPLPEPFDLRINFTYHATQFFKQIQGREVTDLEKADIRAAVDEWGYRLRTPRDMKLALNGLKFHYTPVKGDVYFPDVCRVQLMRVVEPEIYRWIEEYMSEYSVVATGDGRVNRNERIRMGKKLRKMFSDDPDASRSMWTMRELLPGLSDFREKDPANLVYCGVSSAEIRKRSDSKRVGSPFHYRYYFALAPVRTVLPQDEYDKILRGAVQGSQQVLTALEELYRRRRVVGGNWISQFFNRLDGFSGDGCAPEQVLNLMLGIADLMDCVLLNENRRNARAFEFAREAEGAFQQLSLYLAARDKAHAQTALLHVLEHSQSLAWIGGYLTRSELHRHGIPDGARESYQEQRLLEGDYLTMGMAIVRRRIEEWARDERLALSADLGAMLYGWRDLGAIEEARAWVKEYVKSDKGFVDFLLRMRGWAMSHEVYFPLHKKSVEIFLDADDIDARLVRIDKENHENPLGHSAKIAIRAIELAKRF